jgi:3'5'-cyclic nucleotide phosphodiesterase
MKLLGRIQTQEQKVATSGNTPGDFKDEGESGKFMYLDPLTRLGVVFAALIHDADHTGLSNTTLIQEQWPVANLYANKSVAEQNSIDVAWKLFMEPKFIHLRQCMFVCEHDLRRFRQIIVNSVLATDIFDKDLELFREDRWKQTFWTDHENPNVQSTKSVEEMYRSRKNAIVIEHLIQASDVIHTMQHWKIYQKWNKRLFLEHYAAYQQGHSKNNPSNGWYDGEIWFFDYYVIPLAKK